MSALRAFFVMGMIVTVLAVVALAQLAIALLPYLAAALVVLLILRFRRSEPRAAAPPHAVLTYRDPQPRYRVGAPAAAPEGWVMVPVWVAPRRPDPTMIDAEVITGDG
jgi:hypothetical protein